MATSISNQKRLRLPVQAFEMRPSTSSLFDLSAFFLAANGKVRGTDDFVFYNNRKHPAGAAMLHGNVPPCQCNDLWVDLTKVPAEIVKIVFVLSFYPYRCNKPGAKNSEFSLHFANAPRGNGDKLLTLCLPHTPSEDFSVHVGELERCGGGWDFTASGELREGGLAKTCHWFGIETVE